MKEKIGQMLMMGFQGMTVTQDDAIVKAILAQQIGGVILFDYNFPSKTYDHNIKNPAQVKQLTQQLQHFAQQAAVTHKSEVLPLFVAIDYEGGSVNRLKESYGFPKTLSAADIGQGSVADAEAYARVMATTLKAAGININFAPVLDVNVNPDNPVIGKLGRSFSADPHAVAQYASIFAEAFQDQGILSAFKHFPGHGSSTGDTHAGFVDVTHTWCESELEPYKQLVSTATLCPMVMMAHVVHYGLDKKGYPASLSKIITQEWLRGKLNFNGVVVSDDMQMKAITDNYGLAEGVELAINGGADILVFGNQLVPVAQDPSEIVEMIYAAVQSGRIAQSRIDEAYARIIKLKKHLKQKMG